MTIPRTKLLLALLALAIVSTAPLRAATTPPTRTNFFSSQTYIGDAGNGYTAYYLPYFKTYLFPPDSPPSEPTYLYKNNFGFLYFFDPASGDLSSNEAYFYDFTSKDYFYTSSTLYPYFYSFNLGSFLYYFEGSNPRQFYENKTSSFIYY